MFALIALLPFLSVRKVTAADFGASAVLCETTNDFAAAATVLIDPLMSDVFKVACLTTELSVDTEADSEQLDGFKSSGVVQDAQPDMYYEYSFASCSSCSGGRGAYLDAPGWRPGKFLMKWRRASLARRAARWGA